MDDFNTIRLKRKTVDKFKKYSKKTSPNYSETLDYMIAYFEDNSISPYDLPDTFGFKSLLDHVNKRTDVITTMLRDMEKNHFEPNSKRLETLFDAMDAIEELHYIDKNPSDIEAAKSETEKMLDNYYNAYKSKSKELQLVKTEFINLLENIALVKNTFGKEYYRLDISKEKLEDIKTRFF